MKLKHYWKWWSENTLISSSEFCVSFFPIDSWSPLMQYIYIYIYITVGETTSFCTQHVVSIKRKRLQKSYNFQINPQLLICSIQSSIEILILRINSITSLPNSNASPKVGRLFHFSPWFWICVFWPTLDQQTSNFFNLALDSVNSNPYIYTPFSSLVLGFGFLQWSL
jgi:hypothetical protein